VTVVVRPARRDDRPHAVAVLARALHADPGWVHDAAFPAGPVAYLQVLGVDPPAQRTGVGSALLAEGLRRADREAVAAYLETASEANVAYYAASGFAVLRESGPLLPGGPVMWRMRREPSTAGSAPRATAR